jgi:solute:Na+ symporter, SSS family
MPVFSLHAADIAVIAVYSVLIVWIGVRVARHTSNTTDYFLAGRSLTWYLIGFSLLASNMSSTSLIGMAGSAYATGISVFNYEWMAAIVLIFFSLFVLPQLIASRVFTMPEFLEKRYDRRARFYFSGWTIVGNIFIDTAGALYAGALVLYLIYPALPFAASVGILAVLAGIYTVLGGLRAVVYTDSIQAVLLLFGAALISVLAFIKVGAWSAVTAHVDAGMLSLMQPATDPFLPWPGLVFGIPLLGFYFWCSNQFMVQRMLGAKNIEHARGGALFAGFLKLPVLFIMVLPGIFALVLYPDLLHLEEFTPDMIFPVLVFDLLPTGLRGLIFVALIAAIMSSIDSTLNSASTLVTMDFLKPLKTAWNEQRLLLAGRIITALFMLIAAAWAPVISKFPSLWQYLQSVLAYQCPPFVAALLLGIFWKQAGGRAAFWGLIGGHIVSMLLFVAVLILQLIDLHFLYVAPIVFTSSALLIIAFSYFGAPQRAADYNDVVWTPDAFAQESIALAHMPWYRNHRIISGVLLACTAAVVLLFW